MEPISALTAAYQGLNIAINCIDRLVQYRAQKKLEKLQRIQGQQQFLHDFAYAAAPDEESEEVETIRSYCRKLQNITRAHWGFIFGRGRKNAEAAHAVIASTLFHVGAMPGLPTSPRSAPNLVAENLAITYQNATSKLYSDVARLLESMTDLNPGRLSFTMQKVDEEIQIGFAMSANLQAKSDASQLVMSSGLPVSALPYVDEETSQANLADLMASQSSSEDLNTAYERVENRCNLAVSRSVSPCSSQRSSMYSQGYPSLVFPTSGQQSPFNISSPQFPSPCSSARSSIYSSECPTPTYQTYSDREPFATVYTVPLQEMSTVYTDAYEVPSYRPVSHGGSYGNGKGGNSLKIDTGGWVWGSTVESPTVDGYQRKYNRSWSC